MNKREEYERAWRYVRQVNNPAHRREADNSGLSLSMIGLAYRAHTASWRYSVTLRLHTEGRRYSEDEARVAAKMHYATGKRRVLVQEKRDSRRQS